MPLPKPAPRKLAHTRTVTCRGYQRDDGLWDIEGHLQDTKPFSFPHQARGGAIEAGEPIHEMWIRITIDSEFTVHDAIAVTDWSPYQVCPAATDGFRQLVGLQIGPGWTRNVKDRLGGIKGCTHLTELLGPVATTAFQTLWPFREAQERTNTHRKRPPIIDTCHALRSDGAVVASQWPQFHRPSGDLDEAS